MLSTVRLPVNELNKSSAIRCDDEPPRLARGHGAEPRMPSGILDSPALVVTLDLARKVAETMPTAPVMIHGERGTGVHDLAELVHRHGAPANRPKRFAVVSGHALSSEEMRRTVLPDTLLIEDIEHLKPSGQAWLAGVLSARERTIPARRIIVSSRFSMAELLGVRGIHQELLHALDVVRLSIPPLRNRRDEIVPLAREFLWACTEQNPGAPAVFSPTAEYKLQQHDYAQANVRELRNVVERAVAVETTDEIQADSIVFYDVPSVVAPVAESPRPPLEKAARGRLPTFAEVEHDYLVYLIRALRGRRSAIANAMGLSYCTVKKKIEKYGIDVRAIVDAGV